MYSYYVCRTLKYRFPNWFRMALTSVQSSQMLVGCLISYKSYQYLQTNFNCLGSYKNIFWSFLMYSLYFLLFARFFISNYLLKKSVSISKLQPKRFLTNDDDSMSNMVLLPESEASKKRIWYDLGQSGLSIYNNCHFFFSRFIFEPFWNVHLLIFHIPSLMAKSYSFFRINLSNLITIFNLVFTNQINFYSGTHGIYAITEIIWVNDTKQDELWMVSLQNFNQIKYLENSSCRSEE